MEKKSCNLSTFQFESKLICEGRSVVTASKQGDVNAQLQTMILCKDEVWPWFN